MEVMRISVHTDQVVRISVHTDHTSQSEEHLWMNFQEAHPI